MNHPDSGGIYLQWRRGASPMALELSIRVKERVAKLARADSFTWLLCALQSSALLFDEGQRRGLESAEKIRPADPDDKTCVHVPVRKDHILTLEKDAENST